MHEFGNSIRLLAFAGAIALIAPIMPRMAFAQEIARPQVFRFDIRAGAMSATLTRFSEITGVQLVYSSDFVKDMRSAGLSGELSASDALAQILQGTGLEARFKGATTASIVRVDGRQTRVLGPVRVEGAQNDDKPRAGEGVAQLGGIRGGQDQETRGYRPVVASVGMTAPTAIEDIPRSISVLTSEQIEKQDIDDMGEVLRRLPGVTLIESEANSPPSGGLIVSRGFAIDKVQVDGGVAQPLNIIDNGLLDISPYERIELVRGPNGNFAGDGSPGGSLNLVRKRPGMVESLSVRATVGSWQRRQLGLDYSTPSIAGSPIAFRGTASWQDQEFFYDIVEKSNWTLYGIFDAPLGDDARLELGVQHNDVWETGSYNGVPRYYEGPLIDLPRDYNFTTPWAYNDVTSSEVFGKLHMNLPRHWSFEIGVTYATQDAATVNLAIGSIRLLQATNTVRPGVNPTISTREWVYDSDNIGTHFLITGQERTFGIDHRLAIRGEFAERGSPSGIRRRFGSSRPFRTIADLDPTTFPDAVFPEIADDDQDERSTVSNLVLEDTISWRDWFDLRLSLRGSRSGSKSFERSIENVPGSPSYGEIRNVSYSSGNTEGKTFWKPGWSLVLKPLGGLSVTGDLSSGTRPQDQNYTLDRQPLGPLVYQNKEIGLKYGRRNWFVSLAAYDTVRTNLASAIPDTRGLCPPNPNSSCYFAMGDTQRSKGVDFEISGEIFDGLSTTASYNYNSIELVPGTRDAQAVIYTQAPSRMAKLLLDWEIPFLHSTSVNMDASYRSRVFQAGTLSFYDPVTGQPIPPSIPYEFTEPSYVIVGLGFNRSFGRDLSMNLRVENLTDREYLSTVSSAFNFVGAPRSYVASVRWNPRGMFPADGRSPSTGKAPFGDPGRWYGSFELGMHDAGTFTGTSSGLKRDGTPAVWDFETRANAASFVRLGYRLDSHWRAEAEGGFRGAKFGKISGGGSAPTGVCDSSGSSSGRAFNCEDAPGDANAWSLMFNGLYDFRAEEARLRPFVGLGVGVSRWGVDFGGKMKGVGPDTPWNVVAPGTVRATHETIAGIRQSFAFAWQASTGATFRWSDRAYLTAAYTFFNVPKLTWDSYNMPTLTPTLGEFDGDVKDHSLALGIRWFFGEKPN